MSPCPELTRVPSLPVRLSRDRSTLQVLNPTTKNWASACFDSFTEALAKTACRQMGYDRYPAQGPVAVTSPHDLSPSLSSFLFSPFPLSLPLPLSFLKIVGIGIRQLLLKHFPYKQHEVKSCKPQFVEELMERCAGGGVGVFPGGPVAKTLHLQCRGPGLISRE